MTSTELPAPPGALRSGLAAVPALLLALLPKFACPACWPAYGSVLSALGLGGLLASPWRVPLLAAFLTPALWLLARGCRRRRRWPFALGIAGAAASVVGACVDHLALSLAGSAAFVVAMISVAAGGSTTTAARPTGGAASTAPCCRRAETRRRCLPVGPAARVTSGTQATGSG